MTDLKTLYERDFAAWSWKQTFCGERAMPSIRCSAIGSRRSRRASVG